MLGHIFVKGWDMELFGPYELNCFFFLYLKISMQVPSKVYNHVDFLDIVFVRHVGELISIND